MPCSLGMSTPRFGVILPLTWPHQAAGVARRNEPDDSGEISLTLPRRQLREETGQGDQVVDAEKRPPGRQDHKRVHKFTHKDPTGRGFSRHFPAGDAGIQPARFAQALAANCGAEVWEQSEVFGWKACPMAE